MKLKTLFATFIAFSLVLSSCDKKNALLVNRRTATPERIEQVDEARRIAAAKAKIEAEEATRKAAVEKAIRGVAVDEARRIAAAAKADEVRRKALEDAKAKIETEEATKKTAVEEAIREVAVDEARRIAAAAKADEVRRKALEDAKAKIETEEATKKAAAEEATRKAAEENCPICYEDNINPKDRTRCAKCKQPFHTEGCLKEWLKYVEHHRCPHCRATRAEKPFPSNLYGNLHTSNPNFAHTDPFDFRAFTNNANVFIGLRANNANARTDPFDFRAFTNNANVFIGLRANNANARTVPFDFRAFTNNSLILARAAAATRTVPFDFRAFTNNANVFIGLRANNANVHSDPLGLRANARNLFDNHPRLPALNANVHTDPFARAATNNSLIRAQASAARTVPFDFRAFTNNANVFIGLRANARNLFDNHPRLPAKNPNDRTVLFRLRTEDRFARKVIDNFKQKELTAQESHGEWEALRRAHEGLKDREEAEKETRELKINRRGEKANTAQEAEKRQKTLRKVWEAVGKALGAQEDKEALREAQEELRKAKAQEDKEAQKTLELQEVEEALQGVAGKLNVNNNNDAQEEPE